MTIDERHQMELTIRTALRGALDEFQLKGKSFDFMRDFVIGFMDGQEKELSNAHNAVMGQLPQKNIYRRSELTKEYNHLLKAMHNIEDGIMAEIDFRQEKRERQEVQPA